MDHNLVKFDMLKELSNIGTGNALTALSKLINEDVVMQVPKIKLIEFKNVSKIIGNPENYSIGILSNLVGEINGSIMFLLDLASANYFISTLIGKNYNENNHDFDEMDLSVLTELGNIVFGTYEGAIGSMLNKKIRNTVPRICIDMTAAILSVPAIEFGKISEKVILIESLFDLTSVTISGYFILVPDAKSFESMAAVMGIEV